MTVEPFEIAELDSVTQPVARAIRDGIVAGIKAIPARPDGSHPFNHTGKLANGIKLEKNSDGSYSITAPPDRLQNPKVVERLIEAVPLIADPLSAPTVSAAVAESLERLVK